MTFEIYTKNFYEKLDEKIEKIEEENTNLPFLSLDMYKKQKQIVEDFLQQYKLKIYGGVALDKFMPDDDKIYKNRKGKLVDYDAYSPTPLKHAVELGNRLFNAGFKYVMIKEGVNAGVYKIFNYFQEAVDIVFMPAKIYDLIPSQMIDGLNYVKPEHLRIDLLVALTNPKQGLFRWKKDYERLLKLEKYFPVKKPRSFCDKKYGNYGSSNLEKRIQEFVESRDDYILFGDMAYYAYMQESGLKDFFEPTIKYMEIGMQNPSLIFDELKKLGKVKIRRYHQFLKHIPTRYIVTPVGRDNNILLIIYELSEKCIPYVEYKGHKILTYHGLVLYYNFMKYLSGRYGIKDRQQISECCLYELQRAKESYFSRKGENEFGDNIFRNFVLPCLGKEKNILRESKKRSWGGDKKGFVYVPSLREHLVLENKVPPGIVRFVSGEIDKEI